jgi:hypothetical protein
MKAGSYFAFLVFVLVNLTAPRAQQPGLSAQNQAAPATLQQIVESAPTGATIKIPANTKFAAHSSIHLSKDIWITCENRATSVLVAPPGKPLFLVSGTVRQFRLEGCTLIGSGAGSIVANFSNSTASEGRLSIENNTISTFGGDPITFGISNYIINVEKNTFVNNDGGLYVGNNSDAWISDNFFQNTRGTGSPITVVGPDVHIVGNYFVRGSGNTTGPDILLDPYDASSHNSGYIWIVDNKFGNDGGELPTRAKIQVRNANPKFIEGPVVVRGNNFFGVRGQTAVRLDNPIRQWLVEGNYWSLFDTLIDDHFADVNGPVGQSIFTRTNRMYMGSTPKIFANGGRGFSDVEDSRQHH